MNIAVFVSGKGSNLQALIDAEKEDGLAGGRITLVVSDRKDAYALERAERAGIKTVVLEAAAASSREAYDAKVDAELERAEVEFVVLAGFMRILSGPFVKKYSGRMINIHPSLLPDFKGAHGIRDAFNAGVKTTGVTVHFVTEDVDDGPVILQVPVRIEDGDTVETLEEKIHAEEHKLYPKAVRLFVEGRMWVDGKKVKIKGE